MRSIADIYNESILDNDDTIKSKFNKATVTAPEINDYFKKHIYNLASAYYYKVTPETKETNTYKINEDGGIIIFMNNDTKEIYITENLPEFINIVGFENARNQNIKPTIYFHGDKVTSLRGLPDNFDGTLIVRDCPNLKDFKDAPKHVTFLQVINCSNIKSLKDIPSCNSIQFKKSPNWKVDDIAKAARIKKTNIVVI